MGHIQARGPVLMGDERLQLALDAGQMGTWSYDLESGAQSWDHRQLALFGLSPDVQPTRDLFMSMVLPEDLPAVDLGPQHLVPGVRHTSRFRIRRADGAVRWLNAHSLTRADASGRPVELVGVNWDVTEQTTAEAAARQSAEHLQLALDAGRMGTWRYDLIGGTQQWDDRQYDLFGLPRDVSPSREAFMSVVVPEDAAKVAFTEDDLRPGHFLDTEFRIRRPNGEIRWLTARSFARHDAHGRPIERIGVNWDITAQKVAEMARADAERRLATTARELQHRVKNTLAVVQSIATQTFRSAPSKDEGMAAFSGRLRALAAATELLTRGNWEAVPLSSVVREIVAPYYDEGADRVSLSGDEQIRISSQDAVSLGMALHELCTNAVKYGALSSEGGTVSIAWGVDERGAVLNWRESGGPTVTAPETGGFGTRLLRSGLFSTDDGGVNLRFEPGGVTCEVVVRRVV